MIFLSYCSQSLRWLVLGLILSGLFACKSLSNAFPIKFGPVPTPIHQLASQSDGIVYLQGKVGDRVDLLGSKAYQLLDGTGEVWVLSTGQSLPESETNVTIKGKVHFQSIPFGTQEFGEFYVIEMAQLGTPPNPATPSP